MELLVTVVIDYWRNQ